MQSWISSRSFEHAMIVVRLAECKPVPENRRIWKMVLAQWLSQNLELLQKQFTLIASHGNDKGQHHTDRSDIIICDSPPTMS